MVCFLIAFITVQQVYTLLYPYHADRKKPVLPPLKYLIGDTGIYPGGTYAANRNS